MSNKGKECYRYCIVIFIALHLSIPLFILPTDNMQTLPHYRSLDDDEGRVDGDESRLVEELKLERGDGAAELLLLLTRRRTGASRVVVVLRLVRRVSRHDE